MALLKNVSNTKGVVCNYWRIACLSEHAMLDGSVKQRIILHGYINKDFRATQGAEPASEIVYLVQDVDDAYTVTKGISYDGAYSYLKLLPEFEGAQDD